MKEIPVRQAVRHNPEMDPRDPDLTLPLRPSPQGDHDNVPDRVPPTESSAASETDGTTSLDTSTTDETSSKGATSSDTEGTEGTSDSSSDSSSESSSSSVGSRPPSPLHASTPSADMADGHQEQITPREADTSIQARQFFSEMLGRPLTRTEFRKQKNALKRQLAILVQVSKRAENQLPKQEPGEPQPGTSKDSNDSDNVDSSDDTPRRRRNNTQ